MNDEQKLKKIIQENCIVGDADKVCWLLREECLRLQETIKQLRLAYTTDHFVSVNKKHSQ